MLFHGVEILIIALLALLIDRVVGEFQQIRHPVILIGDLIKAFEQRFYQPSIQRGGLLTLSVLLISTSVALLLTLLLSLLPSVITLLVTAVFASTLLAHRMLHDSVQSVLHSEQPQQALKALVSRDTETLSHSDCYKAGIESYAENLSDGVIAPLCYLLLFGLPGIVLYKAVNTLDSMVGYRTPRYEKFGKVSARVDDLLNWIPARITAIMIRLVNMPNHRPILSFYQQGRLHDSPNAGHPISAMALNIGCQLGGDTVYFGQLKPKAYFGDKNATKVVETQHLKACLQHRSRIDLLLYLLLSFSLIISLLAVHNYGI